MGLMREVCFVLFSTTLSSCLFPKFISQAWLGLPGSLFRSAVADRQPVVLFPPHEKPSGASVV